MAEQTILLENWSAQVSNQQQRSKISYFFSKITQTKSKWMRCFQQSIELWMNFMIIRTQCAIQQYNLRSKNNIPQNTKFADIQNEIVRTLSQTQLSVLKALKNIQKLYMIPQLRQKSNFQQKQIQVQRKVKSKSKTHQKNRSTSLTSSFSRSRKASLFSTNTKPFLQKTLMKTNFSVTSDNFSRFLKQNNCHITKHQKQKPKYSRGFEDFKPNFISTLPCQSKINPSTFTVNSENRSAQDYFLDKQKKKQKQISDKVSNKFEQKLKNIQEDLSSKLNKIIQSLQQNKSSMRPQQKQTKNQSKQIKREQNEQQCYQINPSSLHSRTQKENNTSNKQNTLLFSNTQKNSFHNQSLKNRQIIKRNSVIKKCTRNPIQQQTIQQIQGSFQIKLSDLSKKQNVSQRIRVENQLNFIENVAIIQKDLKQFIISATKIKPPQYQKLVHFFGSRYINLCEINNFQMNLQNIGYENLQIKQVTQKQGKSVLKQFLSKLKKVLKIGDPKVNSKLQMMRLFAIKCVKCGYSLVLNKLHDLKDDINIEIEQIMEKL